MLKKMVLMEKRERDNTCVCVYVCEREKREERECVYVMMEKMVLMEEDWRVWRFIMACMNRGVIGWKDTSCQQLVRFPTV
jgi:tryptophan 2,3-dioxygenase